ncbi:MAG: hypothetical protein ACJAZP_002248 [Psychromonas sp.]|jgi:hypothetical protein
MQRSSSIPLGEGQKERDKLSLAVVADVLILHKQVISKSAHNDGFSYLFEIVLRRISAYLLINRLLFSGFALSPFWLNGIYPVEINSL